MTKIGPTQIPLDASKPMTSVEPTKKEISATSARAMAAMRRAAIKARRKALEDEGQVMIVRDGKMVWETDPSRIFPSGVEVEICKCGRVIATDTVEDVVYK